MPRFTDTIAALATPAGVAALAVIRVSGPDTGKIAVAIGAAGEPRRVQRLEYRDLAGNLLDEILVTFFAGPRSYTGEDTLELSTHGNPFIAQRILEDLLARGCRAATPGEFTQRAFLSGKMDLSQAEAVMDLIHARSERALAAAHHQLRGALGRRLQALIDALLGALARIEAYIDFPEEDLPVEDRRGLAGEITRIAAECRQLLATSHYGELLRDGIKTVLVGAPNVGKSSLLNRLVGRDRALVSPEPGTTRDFLEERIVVGPHCLRIIDTAGLNPSPAPLEHLGMEKTRERLEEADLWLVVVDATRPDALPAELVARLVPATTLVIVNKCDLADGREAIRSGLPVGTEVIAVSALTGAGLAELIGRITARADGLQPATGDEIIAINARHAHALGEAKEGLQRALERLRNPEQMAVELLASDLRVALDAFGEITGKVDNERMLDQLFATFCIGK
jgi:tRNA modification GTPase